MATTAVMNAFVTDPRGENMTAVVSSRGGSFSTASSRCSTRPAGSLELFAARVVPAVRPRVAERRGQR